MGTQKVGHFGAAIICKEKYFRPADGVLVFYGHPFVIARLRSPRWLSCTPRISI